jgi:eukaryotic-like serine/threonine-protein kinase
MNSNSCSASSSNAACSFSLGNLLGRGSCGSVHHASLIKPVRDLPPGTPIAVKIIHPELLESTIVLARLKREVEIGIRVRSRNVVAIYGVEKFRLYGQTTLAILMELIEGTSLKDVLAEKKSVHESSIMAIARQMAKGLRDIHALGIVHRDIKPANLIMTEMKRVVLTDLGIARLPDLSAKVTTTGTFIGTCAYASPEQFEDTDNLDPRSDLYSLGVVLYELATGINPFRTDSLITSVQAHLKGLYPPPREINPKISPVLEGIILKLLSVNREDRPDSAEDLLKILVKISDSDETTRVIDQEPAF